MTEPGQNTGASGENGATANGKNRPVDKKGRVAWRDTFDVWPSLRIEVQLAPWQWRIHWYRDDLEPVWSLHLGPLHIDFGANRPYFPLERRSSTNG